MELVLLRHGHALSAEESGGRTDSDRKLSGRGRSEVAASLARLSELGFAPGRVVSSPLRRARETALAAAEHFGLQEACELEELASPCGLEETLRAIIDSAEGADSLLAVGHQPTLGALAASVSGAADCDLSTAGFAYLRLDPRTGKGELVELYTR